MAKAEKIAVESILHPGKSTNVDRDKYEAMRQAMLAAAPASAPGLTVAELKAALLPRLSQALFPAGDKAGWWLKCVQLDLEAKGVLTRGPGSPVRLWRA